MLFHLLFKSYDESNIAVYLVLKVIDYNHLVFIYVMILNAILWNKEI